MDAAAFIVVYVLANFSYAGMRAQNHPGTGWRIASFLCGFPVTLLSYICVAEGGERVFGVDLPRNHSLDAELDDFPGEPTASSLPSPIRHQRHFLALIVRNWVGRFGRREEPHDEEAVRREVLAPELDGPSSERSY